LKNGSPYEQEWGKCSTFYRGEWFQIQLPTPVSINSYVIQQTIDPVVFNGWVFLGSSDGLNWTLLDSNVLGSWTYGASPTIFTLTNSAAPMTHYRFVITHAHFDTVYVRGFSIVSANGYTYPNASGGGYIYNASSPGGEIVWDDDTTTYWGDIDNYGTSISITGYTGVLGTYNGQVPPTIVKSNAYLLDTSYNVGIGTNNPVYKLDVVGNARVSSIDVVGNARVSSSLLLGTSTDTSRAISALYDSMATGARYITLGKSPTTNNQAEFSYNHISDGAINNFASLGLYDNPNILNVMSSAGRGFGRIGVNMINPTYTLDVVGDINFTGNLLKNKIPFTTSGGSSQFTTSTNTSNVYIIGSNVGIGTTSPQDRLHVSGGVLRADNNIKANKLLIGTSTDSTTSRFISALDSSGTQKYISFGIANSTHNQAEISFRSVGLNNSSNSLSLGLFGSENTISISGNGYVGIGNLLPMSRLDVTGDVNITGVVRLNGESTILPLPYSTFKIPQQIFTSETQVTTFTSALPTSTTPVGLGRQIDKTGIFLLDDNRTFYNGSGKHVLINVIYRYQNDANMTGAQRKMRIYSTRNTPDVFNYNTYTQFWQGQAVQIFMDSASRIQFGFSGSDNGITLPLTVYVGYIVVSFVQYIPITTDIILN
jgi:hypothetical protein